MNAIATYTEVTLESAAFKRTEERLREWAAERGRVTAHLRIPVLSSMLTMVEYLKREKEPEEVVRSSAPKQRKTKRARPKYRVRQCTNAECRHFYAAPKCPKCSQPPLKLTAGGSATAGSKSDAKVGFTSSVAEIDKIVSDLPGRSKAAIFRGYMYSQPDRIAARELDIPREAFTLLRKRAVILVADKLAERRDSGA